MTSHRPEDSWGGLLALVRRLRGPHGCPWDRGQTVTSLAPFLVEEAYEVLHAVEAGADHRIQEEAGDLAFVLSLFLLTAEQEGRGTITGTLETTVAKIRARHPHVFAPEIGGANSAADDGGDPATNLTAPGGGLGVSPDGSRTLQLDWERIKQAEAAGEGGRADSPAPAERHRLPPPHPALPALAQAAKLQSKAANLGFDWPDVAPVFDKVREELGELEDACSSGTTREVREELGDLLFAVVNLARFLDLEPESTLRRASRKFRDRFHLMLAEMEADGVDPLVAGVETMDIYWERAKRMGTAG